MVIELYESEILVIFLGHFNDNADKNDHLLKLCSELNLGQMLSSEVGYRVQWRNSRTMRGSSINYIRFVE